MSFVVERFINTPITSNSYLVYEQNSPSALLIDPGSADNTELDQRIESLKLFPEYILLTHEHFDHIWGVDFFRKKYRSKVVCSKECSVRLKDKKKNMSVFHNQVGFETEEADITTEELDHQLIWNQRTIEFIDTPGHTKSGICIYLAKALFSGDTFITNIQTVTKLPGGSKEELKDSLRKIQNRFKDMDITIYPGHEESFSMEKFDINTYL